MTGAVVVLVNSSMQIACLLNLRWHPLAMPQLNSRTISRRQFFLLLTLMAGLSGSTSTKAAGTRSLAWHPGGGVETRGRLVQLIGPMAAINEGNRTAFLNVDTLNDEELGRVADYAADDASQPAPWQTSRARVTRSLRGNVSTFQNGSLVPFEPSADRHEPDVYLIYFSAGWCPPCHRFTPELVSAYAELQKKAPGRFEVIFISSDRSAGEQLRYVREMGMPWLVLDYRQVNQVDVVERWAGDGIPCLVALTRNGELLFHTYQGENYLGPEQVVASCARLIPLFDGQAPMVRRALHRLAILTRQRKTATDLPPERYLIQLDQSRLGGIRIGRVQLTLTINLAGHVTDCVCPESTPLVVANLLRDATAEWLFLPAIKHGQPAEATVKIPVQFSTPPAS